MQVYIDANVFLAFYAYSKDKTDELKKLVPILESGEIILLLPYHTGEEVWRNRDGKLHESLKTLRDFKASINIPIFARELDESVDLLKQLSEVNTKVSETRKAIEKLESENKLEADVLIKSIFQNAKKLKCKKYHSKALKRFQRGSPPGKKSKTIGDEINWESLLGEAASEDLYIVSNDGDYFSKFDPNRVNSILSREWKNKHNSELKAFRSLATFFREREIKIEFTKAEERRELVRAMTYSSNFSRTHDLISQLFDYSEFEPAELETLVEACIENNQVSWILTDDDVFAFYSSIADAISKSEKIGADDKQKFHEKLEVAAVYRAENAD